MAAATHIALLRGINVGGHRRVPMAELRALATGAGYGAVQTHLASGNLVLASDQPAEAVEQTLERLIADHFGFAVDVVVRSAAQWRSYLDANPFLDESDQTPNLVMLCIGKQPASDAHVSALQARAGENERVVRQGDALWLYFGDGSGRSKMGVGPAAGIWTTRNVRTVRSLAEMVG